MSQTSDIREAVRDWYAASARQVTEKMAASCCSAEGCASEISSGIYTASELSGLPEDAVLASLGCGNPTALAELKTGEVVLDLGCGGGIDVLLSARRVGPTGKAYGLDMTDEMLALARNNQREAGVDNAEFLKGYIEDIPLPAGSVDVIISNCVVNLSPDKDRVLAEAFRVLKPGGRLAISDIVAQGRIPEAMLSNREQWCGCLAGALHEDEYRQKLAAAGFADIDIEITRTLGQDSSTEQARLASPETVVPLVDVSASFVSAFIRARKPAVA